MPSENVFLRTGSAAIIDVGAAGGAADGLAADAGDTLFFGRVKNGEGEECEGARGQGARENQTKLSRQSTEPSFFYQ